MLYGYSVLLRKLKVLKRIENVYMMLMDWRERDSLFARSRFRWGDYMEQ